MNQADARILNTARRLFADGYISAATLASLKYDSTGIVDDTEFNIAITDRGDVYEGLHLLVPRYAYPGNGTKEP